MPHTYKTAIESTIIRIRRNCANDIDFHQACNTLFAVFRIRGYSFSTRSKIERNKIYNMNLARRSKQFGGSTSCRHIREMDKILKHVEIVILETERFTSDCIVNRFTRIIKKSLSYLWIGFMLHFCLTRSFFIFEINYV